MDMKHDDMSTLFLAGGLGLVALGFGLILAHPDLRRSLTPLTPMLAGLLPGLMELGEERLGEKQMEPMKMVMGVLLPDIERYIKARSM